MLFQKISERNGEIYPESAHKMRKKFPIFGWRQTGIGNPACLPASKDKIAGLKKLLWIPCLTGRQAAGVYPPNWRAGMTLRRFRSGFQTFFLPLSAKGG